MRQIDRSMLQYSHSSELFAVLFVYIDKEQLDKLVEVQKMDNKIVGAIFCLISAVLISARYISAALFMSGVNSWNSDLFAAGLEYVGSFLVVAAVFALIIGILFLGYGVYQDIKKMKK